MNIAQYSAGNNRQSQLTMVQSVLVEEETRVETGHSKLTYDDLLRLPDDDLRHEIIDGEHYVTPSPLIRHQRISRELMHLLLNYLAEHPIGEVIAAPVDVVISPETVVVPDLVFVSRSRAHVVTEKHLQGPPDLVVEILSPATTRRDVGIKRSLYEGAGVLEYWIVDPVGEAVTVHRRQGARFGREDLYVLEADAAATSTVLPGFNVPLRTLFGV